MTDLAVASEYAEVPVEAADAPPEVQAEAALKPAASGGVQWSLASVTAISFSLTFAFVSLALLAGLLPPTLTAALPVDLGVLLLIVPLSALVLAIMGEALRAALRGVPDVPAPRTLTTLSGWRPGSREG
jgi:hypothetical protein